MAGNGNHGNSPNSSNRLHYYQISSYHADDLEQILKEICQTKRTGSLTINFDQGTPRGTIDWKEKFQYSDPSTDSKGPISSLLR